MRAYLLLHGWRHHQPAGHWLRWLAGKLADDGALVSYPQLPDPDTPDLDRWLAELRSHLAGLHADERVVVAHSLGCLLWIHHARSGGGPQAPDRVLLVAPPNQQLLSHPDLTAFRAAQFAPEAADAARVSRASGGRPRLVCSDNDPYCPEGAASAYGRPLELDIELLPGEGHLDLTAGYGPWPAALAWARDGSHRFAPRPAG